VALLRDRTGGCGSTSLRSRCQRNRQDRRYWSNPHQWAMQAQKLASTLERDQLNDLLGVMVHPPACPDNIEMWNWIQYLQTVSALTMTHLNKDEPWLSSCAAVRCFLWCVDRWIGQLKQPLLLYGQKFLIIGNSGSVSYLSALVYCGLALPNLPERCASVWRDERGYLECCDIRCHSAVMVCKGA